MLVWFYLYLIFNIKPHCCYNSISFGDILKELAVTLADDTRTFVFYLNVSLAWEFNLLLLCLHNVFFHSRSSGATHTHCISISPHSLSVLLPLPSPLPDKCSYTYAKKTWAHPDITHTQRHTHTGFNQPSCGRYISISAAICTQI